MSNDRVNGVSSTSNRTLSTLEGVEGKGPSARVLEQRQIEAQAGVKRLERAARAMGFSAPLGSGDDGITRTRPAAPVTTPPPSATPTPPATSVVPPPAQTPPPGLTVGADGFPPGAVRTPGGYTVVATGDDAAWEIYGPGTKPPEPPVTRVWGDPHVNEKDGTRWDFTKDSNFMLPDGTVIRCDTTSEVGRSVSQALTIVAGNDRVDITGINGHHPTTSAKTQDADAWMNQNAAALTGSHTFVMQTDGNNVDWFRATAGRIEGVVTGAVGNVDGRNSYDQIINGRAPQVNLMAAADRFGGMGAGGLGFLKAFDLEAFVNSAQQALAALVQQEEAPRVNAAAERAAPKRAAPAQG